MSDSPGGSETRLGNVQSDSVSHFDFKPLGGVTFRENPNSDVAIVGKGYAEDAQPAEPKPSLHTGKARERRRFNKSEFTGIAQNMIHCLNVKGMFSFGISHCMDYFLHFCNLLLRSCLCCHCMPLVNQDVG